MYVASLQGGVLDGWSGGYAGRNFRIMIGLEKYRLVREKSGKSQGFFSCLAAGNPECCPSTQIDGLIYYWTSRQVKFK